MSTIAHEGLLDHVKRVGERLRRGIEALGHPLVSGVRGAGLLLGVVLTAPVAPVLAEALREVGFLVNPVQPGVVRLAPPLILTAEQVDAFLAALPAALDATAPAAATPAGTTPAATPAPAGVDPTPPATAGPTAPTTTATPETTT